MKKLTILHTEASMGWGGQEIRILNEMLGMQRRGHEMLLAAPSGARIHERALNAGIQTFAVRMDRCNFAPGAFELGRILREHRVSILNTHSSRDSWMGSLAGRFAGVKVLRTRHISSALNKSPLTRLVYGPLCDGIITTGRFIGTQIANELGITPHKIHSIPTGIHVEKFVGADGGKVRAELGLSAGSLVVGVAAVLRSWKGHLVLLEALPLILSACPGVKLLIAGDGPMRPEIERKIAGLGLFGSVVLMGHREDIPEVIHAFDVAIMASYASEGIPQFVLQAMAAGKPIVGTRVGGIPEVVHHGVNGVLIEPRQPGRIAEAIQPLLADAERRRKMGEAGRRMARENHTEDRMLDRLEELYTRILGSGKQGR